MISVGIELDENRIASSGDALNVLEKHLPQYERRKNEEVGCKDPAIKHKIGNKFGSATCNHETKDYFKLITGGDSNRS